MSSTKQPNQNTHVMSHDQCLSTQSGKVKGHSSTACLFMVNKCGEQRGGVAGRLRGLTVGNFKELLQLPDTWADISDIPQAPTVQTASLIIVGAN